MNTLLLTSATAAAFISVLFLLRWALTEITPSPVLRLTEKLLRRADAPVRSAPEDERHARALPRHAAETAVNLLEHGCPCSEVLLDTYGPSFGISRGEAFELAMKLNRQMQVGETCAAVTGACIILEKSCRSPLAADRNSEAQLAEVLHQFTARFQAHHGTVRCRKFLRLKHGSLATERTALAPGIVPKVCPLLVRDAVQILEGMLN